ncbi:hypothetical protein MRX96_003684 [Rhipicephalus microplus]
MASTEGAPCLGAEVEEKRKEKSSSVEHRTCAGGDQQVRSESIGQRGQGLCSSPIGEGEAVGGEEGNGPVGTTAAMGRGACARVFSRASEVEQKLVQCWHWDEMGTKQTIQYVRELSRQTETRECIGTVGETGIKRSRRHPNSEDVQIGEVALRGKKGLKKR